MPVFSPRLSRAIVVAILFFMISMSAASLIEQPQSQAFTAAIQSNSGNLNTELNISSNLSYSVPGNSLKTSPIEPNSNWSATGRLISKSLSNLKIPAEAKLPPNFAYASKKVDGSYGPAYSSGPSPFGVGSYGVYNSSGSLRNYTYSSSSFEGTVSIHNSSELYLSSDNPTSYSIQLNTVLNNVTLFGQEKYQFWTQNVALYNSSTHSITFIDNIWNFSSPTALINGNELYSYTGSVVPGYYYYKIGPTLSLSYPFTLDLYLNATTVAGHNTVFFNYTVTGKNGVPVSGSYDKVEFNSTSATAPKTNPALFEVSGSKLTDTGFIPMDAEIIIGGPGGGSTANFQNINATFGLAFYNGTHYSPVRSAYNTGSETGETSLGISEYYQGTTAYLSGGPSFTQSLWGISNSPGYVEISGNLSPSNVFVFFSKTATVENSSAEWAPSPLSGNFSYRLQNGTYSLEVLLSYHDPAYFNSVTRDGNASLGSVVLSPNLSRGIYTPLYAWDNSQLASLSISGAGTSNSPYIVPGPDYSNSTINGLSDHMMNVFSQVNDYLYPSFYGIFTANTTASVVFSGFQYNGAGAFTVQYPSALIPLIETTFEGVMTNNLGIVFYDSSNIVLNNSFITGWFSALTYYGVDYNNVPTVASLILWNTTDSLIANNIVSSQGSGILLYGTNGYNMGDYVWNNTFRNAYIEPLGGYYSGAPVGLTVASSGNTIYNNAFNSTIPVVSLSGPFANIYTGSWANYTNAFNVTRESSTAYKMFLGVNLTGSIIGLNYQGGNFYYNYFGNGSQSYNGTGVGLAFNGLTALDGSINYTYDYAPLVLGGQTTYVDALNIPFSQLTYFDINNAIYEIPAQGNTQLHLPNGTYQLLGFELVNSNVEYIPETLLGGLPLTLGYFAVSGPVVNISLNYTAYYNLTVAEEGLSPGTLWGFSVPQAGIGYTLTGVSQNLFVQAGDYYILPQSVDGYTASTLQQVIDGPTTVVVHYYNVTAISAGTGNYSVIFTENGLPKDTRWGVDINGYSYEANSSSFELVNVSSGIYNFTVISINGYTSTSHGIFIVDYGNASVSIVFDRSSGFPANIEYLGIGLAVGSFAVGLASYYRRRIR